MLRLCVVAAVCVLQQHAAMMRVQALRTVVLVRHGAVDRAAGGVPAKAMYGGDIDVPLSDKGQAEARAAAEYVAREFPRVQSVWSSPLSRAVYGAQAIADLTNVVVRKREAFREIARGAWLRKTPDEIPLQHFLDDPDFRPPGGAESVNDVRRRAEEALRTEILPSLDRPGDAAVVVSHLYVTRSLLSLALPDTPIPDIAVPTASVSALVLHDDGRWSAPLVGYAPPLLPEDDDLLAVVSEAER